MEGFRRHFLIPFSTVPSRAAKAFDGRSRADVMCRCIVNSLMVSANTRNDTCIACVLLGTPDLQPATLLCCGKHMRALHPTEKTVAGIVQRALPPNPGHPGDLEELDSQGLLNNYEGKRNCCQGTWLIPGGTAAAVQHLLHPDRSGPNPVVFVLQEGAEPIGAVLESLTRQQQQQQQPQHQQQQQQPQQHSPQLQQHVPSSILTLLGDDAGLTDSQSAEILAAAAAAANARVHTVSLGPMQLLASQCITLVHHYLDLAVGASDTQKPRYDPNDPWLDKIRPCKMCYPTGLVGEAQAQAQAQAQQQQQQQPERA